MMRRVMVATVKLGVSGLVWAATLQAQIETPQIGCLSREGGAVEISGLPGNFLQRPSESCPPIENRYRVVEFNGDPWLEQVGAEGAVEHRRKLNPGQWAVFPDGTLIQLDAQLGALAPPGTALEWALVAPDWVMVRTPEAAVLLHRDGGWFYLPGLLGAKPE